VPQVSWALVACKVSRETWERQARWVSKDFLGFLDPLVRWESRGHMDLRVSQVRLAFVASKVRLGQEVCVAHLGQLVLLVLSVFVARQALLELKARWGLLV